jgi:hypothetical protein
MLLASYLRNREQRVMISDSFSAWLPVLSGVPQGSSLGPLLFILYMDDITDIVTPDCEVLLYADDCKILKAITSSDDMRDLQLNLNRLETWCRDWQMKINPTKSAAMRFTLKGHTQSLSYKLCNQIIPWVEKHQDLGVIFDTKLTFDSHIEHIVAKAMRTLGLIYRFTTITNSTALRTFFLCCVLPIIEYASPIWSMASDTNLKKTDKVLNFFLRILKTRNAELSPLPNHEILKKLQMKDLFARRKINDLKFLHSIINGNCRTNDLLPQFYIRVPRLTSRHQNFFYVKTPRLTLQKKSFIWRLPEAYHSLPESPDFCQPKHLFVKKCLKLITY